MTSPWLLSVGYSAMATNVLCSMLLSWDSCVWKYDPNFKQLLPPLINLWELTIFDMPFDTGNTLCQNTMAYTISMTSRGGKIFERQFRTCCSCSLFDASDMSFNVKDIQNSTILLQSELTIIKYMCNWILIFCRCQEHALMPQLLCLPSGSLSFWQFQSLWVLIWWPRMHYHSQHDVNFNSIIFYLIRI